MSRMVRWPGYLGLLAALFALAVAVSCGKEPDPSTAVTGSRVEPTNTLVPAPTPTAKPLPTTTPASTPAPMPVLASTQAPTPTATPRATPAPASIVGTSSADVYARVAPSVAFVETHIATGSGVLIEGGYVVTNHHVVWPFESVEVSFPDSHKLYVPVAAWDPMADIAVLGPLGDGPTPPPLELMDGESLPIGSELYLVGYPAEAELYPQASITRGILSRVREWEQLGMTYFQTDSAITGGQSGGALVNARGEVIGISGFKFSDADFGLVASAADIAPIVGRLISGEDPLGVNSRSFLDGKPGFEFWVDLQNFWDSRAFFIRGGTALEAEIDGPGDGLFHVSDALGSTLLTANNEYTGIEFGTVEQLGEYANFLQVEMGSGESSGFDLTSNIALYPIDDPDDGQSIAVGETVAGSIDHFRDQDWYSVRLEEGDTVRISTDSLNVDTIVYVDFPYSRNNQVVSDDDSGGGLFGTNSELVYRALQSGEYYISVYESAGDSFGGYYLSVEQARDGDETVEVPPSPEVVDSPFGKMIVYEGQLFDFSIHAPADWIERWPDEEEGLEIFSANTPEDEGVVIVEADLFASGEGGTSLEEFVDDMELTMAESGVQVSSRRNTTTSQGIPAIVFDASAGSGFLSGLGLVSIQDGRFALTIVYFFPDETAETNIPLAEYSFDTLGIR